MEVGSSLYYTRENAHSHKQSPNQLFCICTLLESLDKLEAQIERESKQSDKLIEKQSSSYYHISIIEILILFFERP